MSKRRIDTRSGPPRCRKGQTNLRALSALSIHPFGPSIHPPIHLYPSRFLFVPSFSLPRGPSCPVLSNALRRRSMPPPSMCSLACKTSPRFAASISLFLVLSCIVLFFCLIPPLRHSEHPRLDSSPLRPTIFPHFNPLTRPRGRALTRARASERWPRKSTNDICRTYLTSLYFTRGCSQEFTTLPSAFFSYLPSYLPTVCFFLCILLRNAFFFFSSPVLPDSASLCLFLSLCLLHSKL